MIEMLARKCRSGDLWICAARAHMERHEWGRARIAVQSGLELGGLTDLEEARNLLQDVCERLGVRE